MGSWYTMGFSFSPQTGCKKCNVCVCVRGALRTSGLAGCISSLVATMFAREMQRTCGTLLTTKHSAACAQEQRREREREKQRERDEEREREDERETKKDQECK